VTSIAELFQKAILLTASVDSLKSEVRRMNELLADHHERIVRLEAGADLIAEKAKNAALQGAHATSTELLKEIYALKAQIGAANLAFASRLTAPVQDTAKGDGAVSE
jgi:hypothetical protein